jgi:hypothetical protein
MKAPSSDARAILDRYKALESLGSDEKARLLEVIQQRGARGDLPRVDVPPPSAVAHPSWPARVWATPLGKLAVAVGVAALPVIVALRVHRGPGTSDTPETSAVPPRPAEPNQASSSAAPVRVPTEPNAPADRPTATHPRTRVKPTRSSDAPESASASEPTIDEEMRLLNAAQSSLRSGDPREALRLLDEHASRFPASKLADARAVTRLTTLCNLGQATQARQDADRFLAEHPGSPFAERVKKVCLPPARP